MNTAERARVLRRDLSRPAVAAVLDANPSEVAAAAANPTAAVKPGAAVVRSVVIPGEEVRANAALGLLATPDRVTDVETASGLIQIVYSALWRRGAPGKITAAVYVDDVPVKKTPGDGGPPVDAPLEFTWNQVHWVALNSASIDSCLMAGGNPAASQEIDDTVPMSVGVGSWSGVGLLRVPAGVHSVDVRFAADAAAQDVRVKQRRLLAWGV
jgi:hypothetical protein